LAIELHLVRFRLGVSFTFELHCSLPSTPLLLLFHFTYKNMLFASSDQAWTVRIEMHYSVLSCFFFYSAIHQGI